MRTLLFLICLGLFWMPAIATADPSKVAPAAWDKSSNGAMTTYRSPNGREVMMFRTLDDTSDPALAISKIADGLMQGSDRTLVSTPSTDGPLYLHDIAFSKRGLVMKGRVVAVKHSQDELLLLAHLAPQQEAGLSTRLDASSKKMAALAGTQKIAPNTPRPVKQDTRLPPLNSPGVERVLFDLKYKYGVGGAAYPTYKIVALLENGTAVQLGNFALNRIDVNALRREDNGHVGTWRRSGSNYLVSWQDGDTSELKPNVGPPAALPDSGKLVGRFQAIGGGGNTALGGQVLAAKIKTLSFYPDGTFDHSSHTTVSAPRVAGGASKSSSGRWELEGPNLTLAYNDGRTYHTSVFYSASRKSSGSKNRYDVVWIGGEDFKKADE